MMSSQESAKAANFPAPALFQSLAALQLCYSHAVMELGKKSDSQVTRSKDGKVLYQRHGPADVKVRPLDFTACVDGQVIDIGGMVGGNFVEAALDCHPALRDHPLVVRALSNGEAIIPPLHSNRMTAGEKNRALGLCEKRYNCEGRTKSQMKSRAQHTQEQKLLFETYNRPKTLAILCAIDAVYPGLVDHRLWQAKGFLASNLWGDEWTALCVLLAVNRAVGNQDPSGSPAVITVANFTDICETVYGFASSLRNSYLSTEFVKPVKAAEKVFEPVQSLESRKIDGPSTLPKRASVFVPSKIPVCLLQYLHDHQARLLSVGNTVKTPLLSSQWKSNSGNTHRGWKETSSLCNKLSEKLGQGEAMTFHALKFGPVSGARGGSLRLEGADAQPSPLELAARTMAYPKVNTKLRRVQDSIDLPVVKKPTLPGSAGSSRPRLPRKAGNERLALKHGPADGVPDYKRNKIADQSARESRNTERALRKEVDAAEANADTGPPEDPRPAASDGGEADMIQDTPAAVAAPPGTPPVPPNLEEMQVDTASEIPEPPVESGNGRDSDEADGRTNQPDPLAFEGKLGELGSVRAFCDAVKDRQTQLNISTVANQVLTWGAGDLCMWRGGGNPFESDGVDGSLCMVQGLALDCLLALSEAYQGTVLQQVDAGAVGVQFRSMLVAFDQQPMSRLEKAQRLLVLRGMLNIGWASPGNRSRQKEKLSIADEDVAYFGRDCIDTLEAPESRRHNPCAPNVLEVLQRAREMTWVRFSGAASLRGSSDEEVLVLKLRPGGEEYDSPESGMEGYVAVHFSKLTLKDGLVYGNSADLCDHRGHELPNPETPPFGDVLICDLRDQDPGILRTVSNADNGVHSFGFLAYLCRRRVLPRQDVLKCLGRHFLTGQALSRNLRNAGVLSESSTEVLCSDLMLEVDCASFATPLHDSGKHFSAAASEASLHRNVVTAVMPLPNVVALPDTRRRIVLHPGSCAHSGGLVEPKQLLEWEMAVLQASHLTDDGHMCVGADREEVSVKNWTPPRVVAEGFNTSRNIAAKHSGALYRRLYPVLSDFSPKTLFKYVPYHFYDTYCPSYRTWSLPTAAVSRGGEV